MGAGWQECQPAAPLRHHERTFHMTSHPLHALHAKIISRHCLPFLAKDVFDRPHRLVLTGSGHLLPSSGESLSGRSLFCGGSRGQPFPNCRGGLNSKRGAMGWNLQPEQNPHFAVFLLSLRRTNRWLSAFAESAESDRQSGSAVAQPGASKRARQGWSASGDRGGTICCANSGSLEEAVTLQGLQSKRNGSHRSITGERRSSSGERFDGLPGRVLPVLLGSGHLQASPVCHSRTGVQGREHSGYS